MDSKSYFAMKDKGLVSILNTGTNYAIAYAQFNPETGERIEDKVLTLNDKALMDEKASLQARMDDIDAFLNEIANTPVTPPVADPAQPADVTP